jgi:acetylornithine/succinyldiaminopimelate/putrescine aminotransferase
MPPPLPFDAAAWAEPLGPAHPALRSRALSLLGARVPAILHIGPLPQAAALAEALARCVGGSLDVALLATSPADALDAALKQARLTTGRRTLLVQDGHGHRGALAGSRPGEGSLAASTVAPPPASPPGPSSGFSPSSTQEGTDALTMAVTSLPPGDLGALGRALEREKPAALVLEPFAVGAGVRPLPPGYWREARALCRRAGALLISDETRTTPARLGVWSAASLEGVEPDLLVLGEGLGGGVAPVAAALTTGALHRRGFGGPGRSDLHGSTFGGHALACEAALAVLAEIERGGLTRAATARGEQLRGLLAGTRGLVEIRGRGLLLGVEIDRPAAPVQEALAQAKIRVEVAGSGGRVLVLAPRLTLSQDEASWLARALRDAIEGGR